MWSRRARRSAQDRSDDDTVAISSIQRVRRVRSIVLSTVPRIVAAAATIQRAAGEAGRQEVLFTGSA